jgi:uncharacterized membrane protein YebE (DUF533 family)
LNDPTQLLSLFLNGALGRSGRKRARKAARFVSGHRGLLTASGLLTAAGVAWGIFDSLKQNETGVAATTPLGGPVGFPPAMPQTAYAPPPVMTGDGRMPLEVLRIIRLAVSAARADGTLSSEERALILEHARKAGVAEAAEDELDHPHPMADIVRGVTEPSARHDLYTLAFAIVRADETVSGSERIYLAQLAHQLGLDAATAAGLEAAAVAAIDGE